MPLLIIPLLLILIGIWAVIIFNQLVGMRQMAENGWSDIEVQLKRRADLIPRLVSTVKGYAAHENKLFIDVTKKRNEALAAGNNPKKRGSAEAALAPPVGRLMAVAEDYPDLKASQNFLDLQNELADTEDKIEMARRFYNGAVRTLNIKIQSVPSNLIAGPLGFSQLEYFEIDSADGVAPNIEFNT